MSSKLFVVFFEPNFKNTSTKSKTAKARSHIVAHIDDEPYLTTPLSYSFLMAW